MKKLLLLITIILTLTSFTRKELSWVAIGDSITYLNDHLDETGNRVTKGYMSRVTARLPQIHCINQGHNGWTAVGIAKEIEKLGLVKADIYSVFLGTNDWWAGIPAGKISDYIDQTGNGTLYGAYRNIINKIRSLNNEATIILITPMQRTDFVYLFDKKNNAWGSYKEKNGQSLAVFADAVKQIGAYEHFKVVDLYHKKGMAVKDLVKFKRLKDPGTGLYRNYTYPDYSTIPFNAEQDDYPYPAAAVRVTYDGLHPSDKGYEMIAAELLKVMRAYQF